MRKTLFRLLLAALIALPLATQAQSSYSVVIDYDSTMGSVTGAGTYSSGSDIYLTATTNSGYIFTGWEFLYMGTYWLVSTDNYLYFEAGDDDLPDSNGTYYFHALFEGEPQPVYCAGATCQITIEAADEWGDGWNGGRIYAMQNDTIVGCLTLDDDDEATLTLNVCSDYPVVFTWSQGLYDEEVSFTIYDGSNNQVYSCSDASNLTAGATFFTLNSACPSCITPALVFDSATSSTLTCHWTGTATNYNVYLNGALVAANTTATSYTFTGLTASTSYTVGVVAHCSDGDTSAMATLTAHTQCADNFAMPFIENFDPNSATISCWSTIDADGDGFCWSTAIDTYGQLIESGSMTSCSYSDVVGDLTPDNWLISPKIHLSQADTITLQWESSPYNTSYFYAEHYGLYISTSGNSDTGDFTLIDQWTLDTSVVNHMSVDLSSYAGQDVYIAFRHFNCTAQYFLILDNVSITAPGDLDNLIDLTLAVNDATMGTTSPAPGTYHYVVGQTMSAQALPYSGYQVAGWHLTATHPTAGLVYDTTISAGVTTITRLAEDYMKGLSITATVFFEQGQVQPDEYLTVTYTVDDPTMGYVTPSGTFTLEEGDAISVTATAYNGYEFKGWNLVLKLEGQVVNNETTTDEPAFIDEVVEDYMLGYELIIKALFGPIGGEGIDATEQINISAYTHGGELVLEGAEGHAVQVYDLSGRLLHTTPTASQTERYTVPATGLYLLRVEGVGTRRVVVKK